MNLPAVNGRALEPDLHRRYLEVMAAHGKPQDWDAFRDRYRLGIRYAFASPVSWWLSGVPERFWRASMPMNIREYQEEDLGALRSIYFRSRSAAFHWLAGRRYEVLDFDRDTQGELVLIAEAHGKIVGFSSSWLPDRFVHNLYVDPAHIGEGIGGRILEATIGAIGVPARLKCLSRNERALRFYRSQGWYVVGCGSSEDGDFFEMEFGGA
jgi:ribosomal protein S18 acetylase RimI-like enzyme